MDPSFNDKFSFCPKCGTRVANGPQCPECGAYYSKLFRTPSPKEKSKSPPLAKKIALVAIAFLIGLVLFLVLRSDNQPEDAAVRATKKLTTADLRLIEDIRAFGAWTPRYTQASQAMFAAVQKSNAYGSAHSGVKEIRDELSALQLEVTVYRPSGCAIDTKEAFLVAIKKSLDILYYGEKGASHWDALSQSLKEGTESGRAYKKTFMACASTLGVEIPTAR